MNEIKEDILRYKEKNREILFTLTKTCFKMTGTKDNYKKYYKIEDIIKLEKNINCFKIILKGRSKPYTLITNKVIDWFNYIFINMINLYKALKTSDLNFFVDKKNIQKKKILVILNEYKFLGYENGINSSFIEKIFDINLNEIINIHSYNFDDDSSCFTIELKRIKYNYEVETIEEKKNWIKEIGKATIKKKYSQKFNNNNKIINEFENMENM